MSDRRSVTPTFWIPLLLGIATVALGLGLPTMGINLPVGSSVVAVALAVLLIIWAGILAYRARAQTDTLGGGRGGHAWVEGNFSRAIGGRGGEAVKHAGGTGGNASVRGNNSTAKGGDGGTG